VPVTRLVEREVTKEVEITRVVVQEKEVEATRIVEVTPTPTPIPTGGFLVTTMSQDLVSFNPILVSDDSSQFVSSFLYGGMLQTDPFSGELVCHFCQSWRSADRTFTFTLRGDVFWSDGEPVTVDDFIYTYAALLWGVANESLGSPKLEAAEAIEVITKVDERTVAVTMKDSRCASPPRNLPSPAVSVWGP
jgi:peptide/nickel transport system substrate-binding protein